MALGTIKPSTVTPTYPVARRPKEDPDKQHLLGLVRDVRAEAQNLKESLGPIKSACQLTDVKARSLEIDTALKEQRRIIEHNREQIEHLFAALKDHLKENPRLHDWAGDGVTAIENEWDRVAFDWPMPPDNERVMCLINRIEPYLNRMILGAARLTIPDRANQHLAQMRIGQSLDFHETFRDELEGHEARVMLLDHIHKHPADINGVVDVARGVIYRASHNPWRRLLSYLLIVVFVVAGGFIAYYYEDIVDTLGWSVAKHQGERTYLRMYIALMMGSLAHIGIDALKQVRTNKESTFLAIEDWLVWGHVRELTILAGVVSLWVGFLGTVYFLAQRDISTFFAIGYSIDSFVDLFLLRFTTPVSGRIASLKAQATQTSTLAAS